MHTTALPASFLNPIHALSLGLARTIHIQCIYGIFGRDITKITVIYGAYIRFWPTLTYIHTSATGGCTVACVRVHLCVFTQATTRAHTHVHTCTHTRTHTRTHTHAHIHTHTHTHIIIRCLGQRNMQLLQIRTHPLIWLGVVITPPPSTTQAYMHAT